MSRETTEDTIRNATNIIIVCFFVVFAAGITYMLIQGEIKSEQYNQAELEFLNHTYPDMTGKERVVLANRVCEKYFSDKSDKLGDYANCVNILLGLK